MGVGVSQRKGLRQKLVGTMARRRVVSPCDHDKLVEVETFRKFFETCGDLLYRSDNRLPVELLGGRHLEGRIRTFCFFGRHKWQTNALSAIDNCAFAGFELVQRLFFSVRRQSADANCSDRLGIDFARAIVLAVELQRLFHTGAFAEKICERVGQAKMSRELGPRSLNYRVSIIPDWLVLSAGLRPY